MKYLITWKLMLGPEQLDRIAEQPGVFNRGLQYIKHLQREGRLIGLYRVIPVEEITRNIRPRPGKPLSPVQPSGIAIVEAESLRQAKEIVEGIDSLTSEGLSVLKYLDYEIKPLEEIGGEEE